MCSVTQFLLFRGVSASLGEKREASLYCQALHAGSAPSLESLFLKSPFFFGSNFSPLATKTTENSFILIPEASPSRPARDGLPFPSDFGEENRQISGMHVLAIKSLTWKGGTPVARSAAPRTAAPGPARSSRDSQSPRPCCCSWGWQ